MRSLYISVALSVACGTSSAATWNHLFSVGQKVDIGKGLLFFDSGSVHRDGELADVWIQFVRPSTSTDNVQAQRRRATIYCTKGFYAFTAVVNQYKDGTVEALPPELGALNSVIAGSSIGVVRDAVCSSESASTQTKSNDFFYPVPGNDPIAFTQAFIEAVQQKLDATRQK